MATLLVLTPQKCFSCYSRPSSRYNFGICWSVSSKRLLACALELHCIAARVGRGELVSLPRWVLSVRSGPLWSLPLAFHFRHPNAARVAPGRCARASWAEGCYWTRCVWFFDFCPICKPPACTPRLGFRVLTLDLAHLIHSCVLFAAFSVPDHPVACEQGQFRFFFLPDRGGEDPRSALARRPGRGPGLPPPRRRRARLQTLVDALCSLLSLP